MGAVVVLRAAIATAESLGLPADPRWTEIADGMAIPRRGKAIISHDNYRVDEEKGATPDALMGIFPFGFPLKPEEEQATLKFYLALAKDYIGSPMLSALYGAGRRAQTTGSWRSSFFRMAMVSSASAASGKPLNIAPIASRNSRRLVRSSPTLAAFYRSDLRFYGP